MMMKKIIGAFLVSSPLTVITVALTIEHGIFVVTVMWFTILIALAVIVAGIHLLVDE